MGSEKFVRAPRKTVHEFGHRLRVTEKWAVISGTSGFSQKGGDEKGGIRSTLLLQGCGDGRRYEMKASVVRGQFFEGGGEWMIHKISQKRGKNERPGSAGLKKMQHITLLGGKTGGKRIFRWSGGVRYYMCLANNAEALALGRLEYPSGGY